MPNTFFQFKQFRINQERSGMKVTTDACLFGAWIADHIRKKKAEPLCVLDIGTGTGLLALMLAQATNDASIDAIDLNENAFRESSENFKNSRWSSRLTSIHSSVQDYQSARNYDLIICNPPFFGKNPRGKHIHKNLALHNDHLSMKELSENISRLLGAEGTAWVLYPEWEMKAFTKWMEKKELFPENEVVIRNKANAPIFRMIGGFSRIQHKIKEKEILIRKEDGSYSTEFSRLMKDYYL